MSQPPRSTVIRRIWKPAAVTTAGGIASSIWIEELMLYAEEILALVLLPILAGVIYLFNVLVFKLRLPRRDDLTSKTHGENK